MRLSSSHGRVPSQHGAAGSLSATGGDLPAALSALERAFELHEASVSPRAANAPGHGNDPSAQPAEEGCSRFTASRAQLLRGDRRTALGRARPRRAGADRRARLAADAPPTEQRVAELVAAGGTYREVADALFISPKTVQWNLSKIYRKLGIRLALAARGEPRCPAHGDESTPAEPPVAR